MNEIYDGVVIGGGFAGVFSALELGEKGYRILLIEAGEAVLGKNSSSYNECYKLHTGVHYAADKETALQCLRDSINFFKKFKPFILGTGDATLPWRKGRHYIMSNSHADVEKVKEVCTALQEEYAKLISEDAENKVWGEPEDFIRYLQSGEYPYVAQEILCETRQESGEIYYEKALVSLGIETPESQIDIERFKIYLKEKLQKSSNITVLINHKVLAVELKPDALGYNILTQNKKTGNNLQVSTRNVVNCAWQNIEKIDNQLGYYIPDGRLIRAKVSLLVKLPEALTHMNTCIFSIGAHCSITNLGNGDAVLTYEPVTNVDYYTPLQKIFLQKPELWKALQAQLIPDEGMGQALGISIVNGVSKYVPMMQKAKVKEVRLGYVKIFAKPEEKYSIFDKNSPIHRRREDGIEVKDVGYISHSGMKMTYTATTASVVSKMLAEHVAIQHKAQCLISRAKFFLKKRGYLVSPIKLDVILYHGFRSMFLEKAKVIIEENHKHNEKKIINQIVGDVVRHLEKANAVKREIEGISFFKQPLVIMVVSSQNTQTCAKKERFFKSSRDGLKKEVIVQETQLNQKHFVAVRQ